MSIKLNGTAEDDVYIIRKLLEQIHNYFEYLECPYYNSDLSERDLLLMLIQPSERRYHLLEWMINRLEPDIDFYLPNDYGKGEYAVEPNIKKDYINAISYLKNLGLCYSRVLVPDIVHAKVGPLVQLKFLVRLLRGIRLKSWNRKPIVRKSKDVFKETNLDKNDDDSQLENDLLKLEALTNNKSLLSFFHEQIEKNPTAKTILEVLENRLDPEQITNLKEKIYICLIKKLTLQKDRKIKTDPVSQISMNSNNMSFADGMIQLIIEEILSPEHFEDRSSLCSSNSYESYCSLTVKDSRSTSKASGDILEKCNGKSLKKTSNGCVGNEFLLKDISKSFSTSVNLTKHLSCTGDELNSAQPKTPKTKASHKHILKINEKSDSKNI